MVHYPKPSKADLFGRLVTQLKSLDVELLEALPPSLDNYDVVVDALFGFSFKGAPRPPFDSILKLLLDTSQPIVSVDIPSGWDVDQGATSTTSLVIPTPRCFESVGSLYR